MCILFKYNIKNMYKRNTRMIYDIKYMITYPFYKKIIFKKYYEGSYQLIYSHDNSYIIVFKRIQ